MSPTNWVRAARDRLRAPAIRKVARRVIILIGLVALAYLSLANLLLQTRLLRNVVSKGPDLELEYDSAYSLWPGRVHFHGLSLAAQDHNIQFAIEVERGEVDVSLHELFVKRFRAMSLSTEGTSFRFRHKVHAVGENAERLAAYPPIGDYPDPPLYTEPEPAPVTDADYDLWEIALENIDVRLVEIWILEHRYAGRALARGGFHLRPARWFEVYPATVRLERGAFMFGEKTIAAAVQLDVSARIERTDVTRESGLGILRSVSAKVSLDSGDADASLADAYLPRGSRALGWARLTASASMNAGVLESGGHLELEACPLQLTTPRGTVQGNVSSRFRVVASGKVAAEVTSAALLLSPDELDHRSAVAIAPKLEVDFAIGDVTEPFRLERAQASLPQLEVPSLATVARLVSAEGSGLGLDGRLDAEALLSWRTGGALEGRVQARLVGGRVEHGNMRATFGARAAVELARAEAAAPATSRGTASLELDGVRLKEGERQSPPFRAAVRTASLSLALAGEPKIAATWKVSAEPADALLGVLIGAPVLEELASAVLDLQRLDARTKLTASKRMLSLELSRGESGALAGQGFWQRPASGKASGAFLLTTNVANLGLAIDGSEVETDMFVADDWLEKRRTSRPPRQ